MTALVAGNPAIRMTDAFDTTRYGNHGGPGLHGLAQWARRVGEVELYRSIGLNGMQVILRTSAEPDNGGSAIYIRIPTELQKPCGKCLCPWCLRHPDATPMWDTLVVSSRPNKRDFCWTVHMPDIVEARRYHADRGTLVTR